MDWPCSFCGGAAHPATGCVYTETMIACWRCTDEAWEWIKVFTNGRARRKRRDGIPTVKTKLSFFEAAGKSHDEIHGARSSLVRVAGCDPVSGEFDPRRVPQSPRPAGSGRPAPIGCVAGPTPAEETDVS